MTGLHLAAYFGIREGANTLIGCGRSVYLKDNYGQTPLSWAAKNGRDAGLMLLLQKGAELETKDNEYSRTPLSSAAENGRKAVVKLLENGAELETEDNAYGRTPLSVFSPAPKCAVYFVYLSPESCI
jgi:ankyrin repeat protein